MLWNRREDDVCRVDALLSVQRVKPSRLLSTARCRVILLCARCSRKNKQQQRKNELCVVDVSCSGSHKLQAKVAPKEMKWKESSHVTKGQDI